MAQTAGPTEQLPDAIGRLASDTTELGIVVGDMFRYACAGLFMQEPESARFAMESRAWVTQATTALDLRVRAIIQRYHPSGDEMRRIAELEHAVSQYSHIADRSNHIADHALALGGAGEALLRSVTSDAPEILYALISMVYEQMRGVFLVTAARDLTQARALVTRAAEVEAFYNAMQIRLKHRIKSEPFTALPLQRLLMVASDMRRVNASVVTICEAILFTPRSID
jgi:phosphate uptake regulator